jgi:signal transduction histidine kinase
MASTWILVTVPLVCAGLGFALARVGGKGSALRPSSGPRMSVGELRAVVARYASAAGPVSGPSASQIGLDPDPRRNAQADDFRRAEAELVPALGPSLAQLVVMILAGPTSVQRDTLFGLVDRLSADMLESRVLLDRVMAGSQQGMYFYDQNHRLVAWNQAGLDILGLPQDLFHAGASLESVIRACAERGLYGPGPADELAASRFAAVLDGTATVRTRSIFGERIFDMRSVPTPDGGLLIFNTDMTEQAIAEEHLEAANETLERRVRQRTEELESLNAAYATAKAEAEEANASKTRFLAAASHDLLQPLNAARLYATSLRERLRARAFADDSLMLALNVEESLEAVEDMLTALLDISRLDAGAMKTEMSAFRVDDIFRQLSLEFGPIATSKGLALTFMPASLPILSDNRLLRRLLQNLVSNALKYTLEGRVIVGVRRTADVARIEVWDTGLGIPKSKQVDVFLEFERLPSAILTAPGVGLGLSIVQRLSRVLDHEIGIRSKPGRGSVFTVSVPRASDIPAARATASQGGPSKPRSLAGLVIAALDNEIAILKGMEALLEGWECTIVIGLDLVSLETRLHMQGLRPDVIIADYHVGVSDGLAVIAALRARFGFCHAVLLTADRSLDVRSLAQDADVRLLNKPLKPAALRSLLSQWRLVKKFAD